MSGTGLLLITLELGISPLRLAGLNPFSDHPAISERTFIINRIRI